VWWRAWVVEGVVIRLASYDRCIDLGRKQKYTRRVFSDMRGSFSPLARSLIWYLIYV